MWVCFGISAPTIMLFHPDRAALSMQILSNNSKKVFLHTTRVTSKTFHGSEEIPWDQRWLQGCPGWEKGLLWQRMLCCEFPMHYLGVTAAGSDGERWVQRWVEVSEGTSLLSAPLMSPCSLWSRNRALVPPGKVIWDPLELYSTAQGVPWENGYVQNWGYWDTCILWDSKMLLSVGASLPGSCRGAAANLLCLRK